MKLSDLTGGFSATYGLNNFNMVTSKCSRNYIDALVF